MSTKSNHIIKWNEKRLQRIRCSRTAETAATLLTQLVIYPLHCWFTVVLSIDSQTHHYVISNTKEMHKMIIGWWILLISRSFPFASMKNPHCSQKGLRFSMTSNLQEDTEYLMLKGCYSTSWLEAFNFLNLLKNPVWVTDTYYLRTNLFFFFSSADSTQETEEISY